MQLLYHNLRKTLTQIYHLFITKSQPTFKHHQKTRNPIYHDWDKVNRDLFKKFR